MSLKDITKPKKSKEKRTDSEKIPDPTLTAKSPSQHHNESQATTISKLNPQLTLCEQIEKTILPSSVPRITCPLSEVTAAPFPKCYHQHSPITLHPGRLTLIEVTFSSLHRHRKYCPVLSYPDNRFPTLPTLPSFPLPPTPPPPPIPRPCRHPLTLSRR